MIAETAGLRTGTVFLSLISDNNFNSLLTNMFARVVTWSFSVYRVSSVAKVNRPIGLELFHVHGRSQRAAAILV